MNPRLTSDEIREIANIELTGIVRMCMILDEDEVTIFLDYILSGLTAFKEGYNGKEDDDTEGEAT